MTQCDPDARTLKDCMEVAASVDAHIKELSTLLDRHKTDTHYKVRRLNKRFTRIAAALEVARNLLECVCEGKEVPPERLEAARTLCAKALGTIRKPDLDGAQE